MTQHYTVNGQHITVDGDIWTIPALARQEGGSLTPSTLVVRIVDGIAAHPMTSGGRDSINDWDIWQIEQGDKLLGWGSHDGEHSYEIRGCVISGDLLEKVAEWSGLQLPVNS